VGENTKKAPGPQAQGVCSMNQKFLTVLFAAIIFSPPAAAQNVVKLLQSDIYFQWKPMPKGSAMCGYSVLGNHLSRDNPKIEWDINIDEVVQGSNRAIGVSAGTFTVKDKARAPRPPITELSFTTQDDPVPLDARLLGTPNSYNGIRGALDLERAAKLLHAISEDRQIVATLKYGDGTSDILKFEGFRDNRKFGRGKNSPFEECLRGLTPHVSKFDIQPLP
jgi:hypothetical protein